VPKDTTPEALLQQALAVDPLHIGSRLMLAEMMAAAGKKKEALDILIAGFQWPTATPEYFYKTALLAKDIDDMETHDTAMAKMIIANSRGMATIYRRGQLRVSGTLE
jgi:predicted Zn-dependent protease